MKDVTITRARHVGESLDIHEAVLDFEGMGGFRILDRMLNGLTRDLWQRQVDIGQVSFRVEFDTTEQLLMVHADVLGDEDE